MPKEYKIDPECNDIDEFDDDFGLSEDDDYELFEDEDDYEEGEDFYSLS